MWAYHQSLPAFVGCSQMGMQPVGYYDLSEAGIPVHSTAFRPIDDAAPLRRDCPILLRQSSFKALEEKIRFADRHVGSHTARFGEIEQRSIALTPDGRALYDHLLQQTRKRIQGLTNSEHQRIIHEVFREFPDDELTLRRQDLAYFDYRITPEEEAAKSETSNLETAIEHGWVRARLVSYEDFLPISAAGIFQSTSAMARTTAMLVTPIVRSSNKL